MQFTEQGIGRTELWFHEGEVGIQDSSVAMFTCMCVYVQGGGSYQWCYNSLQITMKSQL